MNAVKEIAHKEIKETEIPKYKLNPKVRDLHLNNYKAAHLWKQREITTYDSPKEFKHGNNRDNT